MGITKDMLQQHFGSRADSAESAFVERALKYVEATAYNTLFPELKGLTFVPIDTSAPAGAKTTSYKQYTRTGIARFITERGEDVPTTAMFVKEYSHPFYRIGVSYQYTLDDMLASQMASTAGGPPINLDLELAIAAKMAIDKKMDNIARVGSGDGVDQDVGLLGLLNQPNATAYSVANGASGTQDWASKTPDEIIADMTGIIAAMISSTYGINQPTDMILPILQYRTIKGRSMGDGRAESVLSYFNKITPEVKVDEWQFLDGAGTASSDRMVIYKKDPRYVRMMVSQTFFQMPVQIKDLVFKTVCSAKTAGVITPYPLSISYGDYI